MLKILKVDKQFQDFQLVIENVELEQGKTYGLVGHNGAGKSTFLKCVAGIIVPDKLTIYADQRSLENPVDRRKLISFVPDRPALYDWMTVAEFVSFCTRMELGTLANMQASLEQFEVPLTKKIQSLSHGMRSKLGLAISFARSTPYVLMDEPLTGLDMRAREEVIQIIKRFASSDHAPRAVLLSTHSIADLESFCDHIVIFKQGRCVLSSSLDDIRTGWLVEECGAKQSTGHANAKRLISIHSTASASPHCAQRRLATPLEVFLNLG